MPGPGGVERGAERERSATTKSSPAPGKRSATAATRATTCSPATRSASSPPGPAAAATAGEAITESGCSSLGCAGRKRLATASLSVPVRTAPSLAGTSASMPLTAEPVVVAAERRRRRRASRARAGRAPASSPSGAPSPPRSCTSTGGETVSATIRPPRASRERRAKHSGLASSGSPSSSCAKSPAGVSTLAVSTTARPRAGSSSAVASAGSTGPRGAASPTGSTRAASASGESAEKSSRQPFSAGIASASRPSTVIPVRPPVRLTLPESRSTGSTRTSSPSSASFSRRRRLAHADEAGQVLPRA